MDTGLIYLCLAPLILFFAPWGFGSMIAAMTTVRGGNAKRLFWISAILCALLSIGMFLLAWFLNDMTHLYTASSALLILIYLVAGFGTLIAPVIGRVIRKQKPELFKKPVSSNTPQTSNMSVTPKHESVVQKVPVPSVETKAQAKPDPSAFPTAAPKIATSHIFVSYRRSDSADITGRIYDRLIGKFGKGPIFKDVDSIPLGLDFKEYLDMKVGECDVLLAIIGDEWLTASDSTGKHRLDDPTDFVRIEIESALERKIPVIPLLVRDAHMPRENDLPPSMRKLVYRNGTPIRSDPDFHRDMDRLIAALEKYINNDAS